MSEGKALDTRTHVHTARTIHYSLTTCACALCVNPALTVSLYTLQSTQHSIESRRGDRSPPSPRTSPLTHTISHSHTVTYHLTARRAASELLTHLLEKIRLKQTSLYLFVFQNLKNEEIIDIYEAESKNVCYVLLPTFLIFTTRTAHLQNWDKYDLVIAIWKLWSICMIKITFTGNYILR